MSRNTDTENSKEFLTAPISQQLREKLGRVGVLFGGESAERAVSLQSGGAVLKALQAANVNAVGIDIQNDALTLLTKEHLDRAFIVLHGVGGEDGRIQALLNFLQIPYTGSGVQASALAMDKQLCKYLWRGMGLPTADFVSLSAATDWQLVMEQMNGGVMVKPVHEGSSLGMSLARSATELQQAYELASRYDNKVIAEKFIEGGEYTVAILDGEALPPIKLEANSQFYDYHAKYEAEDTRYLCPCGLSEERETALKSLAIAAYQSLGCSGWGRVDLMTDKDGTFYLLEVNTVPGMTSHSLVPMAAKAAGMSFEALVVNILMTIESQ